MDTLQEICDSYFKNFKSKIISLEKAVGGKIVFFDGELTPLAALQLHKVIRKLKGEKIFLILDSPGGDIDTAAKIVHMCKEYFKEFNLIVLSYAKSAATLVCLAADNLFLGKAGELGPIDPQVRHPVERDLYFPALAIKDAIEFIESTKDPYVKIGLTEKIDPYLMGAYKRVLNLAQQYLEGANLVQISPDPKNLIGALTQKYISHGYPLDLKECKKLGIKITFFKKEEIMNQLYDIFEEYVEFRVSNGNDMDIPLVIMSSDLCIQKIKIKKEIPNMEEIEKILRPRKDEESEQNE